jgi:cobalt/nickel transport protein
LLGTGFAGLAIPTAEAHFQLLYTPEAALNESAAVELALVFSHPFDNGYTMDMGPPEAFYVVSQRGEAEPRTTDLDTCH